MIGLILFNFSPVVLFDELMLVFDGVPSVVSYTDSVVSFSALKHLRLIMGTLRSMS